ncbi:hypothetical protein CDL15_Pgr016034 [Punica granatum]|uniref:Uncharacterized protein n=1 Tax=Punica granatum TaxID=22663 RepID=A0A218XPT7_PUNGR|nr:hypothetical protein CDL15_Pgr016034 [Punica granatum]
MGVVASGPALARQPQPSVRLGSGGSVRGEAATLDVVATTCLPPLIPSLAISRLPYVPLLSSSSLSSPLSLSFGHSSPMGVVASGPALARQPQPSVRLGSGGSVRGEAATLDVVATTCLPPLIPSLAISRLPYVPLLSSYFQPLPFPNPSSSL